MYLYRFLNTTEFRQLTDTYSRAEWVPHPSPDPSAMEALPGGSGMLMHIGIFPDTRLFHPDFQSKDFYRTNGALMNELIRVGHGLTQVQPFEYGVAPGVLQPVHVEDVAKDLMDSARSGFRQGVRAQPTQTLNETPEQKAFRLRVAERAKIKQRDRERAALRLRRPIPRQLLLAGAYSDDVASDEDLHGMSPGQWRVERQRKLGPIEGQGSASPPSYSSSSDSKVRKSRKAPVKCYEAITPMWRNPALTRAYIIADHLALRSRKSSSTDGTTENGGTEASTAIIRRWRRDQPVNVDIPHSLRGRRLPAALFDPNWLAQHREDLYKAPYYISVDDDSVPGWSDLTYAADESDASSPDSLTMSRPHPSSRAATRATMRRPSSGSMPRSVEPSPTHSPARHEMSQSRCGQGSVSTFQRVRPRIVIDEKDTEFAVQDDDDEGDEADDWVPNLERRRSSKRRRTSFPRSIPSQSRKTPQSLVPVMPPPLVKSQQSASAVMECNLPSSASAASHETPPSPILPGRSLSFPTTSTTEPVSHMPAESTTMGKVEAKLASPPGGLGNLADLAREFHFPSLGDLPIDLSGVGMGVGTPMEIVPQTPNTVARLMANGFEGSEVLTPHLDNSTISDPAPIDPSRDEMNTTSGSADTTAATGKETSSPLPTPATQSAFSDEKTTEKQYHQQLQAHHQQVVQRLAASQDLPPNGASLTAP